MQGRSALGETEPRTFTNPPINAIELIRDSNDVLLVMLGVFAFAGHDWLAANAGKTATAAVGITLVVLAGIGIRDDIADLRATDAPT